MADLTAEAVPATSVASYNEPAVLLGGLEIVSMSGAAVSEATTVARETPVVVPPIAPDRLVGAVPAVSAIQWLHQDHLGSTRLVTDEAGFVVSEHKFLPFGDEYSLNANGTVNTHKFTGHERDEGTGLDYMFARFYGPQNLFRFLSVDPSADSLEIGSPQTWNRYAYALNNPIILVDPDGRDVIVMGTTDPAVRREAERLVSTDTIQRLFGPDSGRDLTITSGDVSRSYGHPSNDGYAVLGFSGDDLSAAVLIIDVESEGGGRQSDERINQIVDHEFGHAVDAAESGRKKSYSATPEEKRQTADRLGAALKREWMQNQLSNSSGLGLGTGPMGSTSGSAAAEEQNTRQQDKINKSMEEKRARKND